MSITPEALEAEFSLTTAATRLDFLSRRDSGDTALNTVRDADEDDWSSFKAADTSLDTYEALELLALGEVVARKAHDSRLIGIRAALRGRGRAGSRSPRPSASPRTRPGTPSPRRSPSSSDADAAAAARELAGARPGR